MTPSLYVPRIHLYDTFHQRPLCCLSSKLVTDVLELVTCERCLIVLQEIGASEQRLEEKLAARKCQKPKIT